MRSPNLRSREVLHQEFMQTRDVHKKSLCTDRSLAVTTIMRGELVWHLAFLRPQFLHPGGWIPFNVACELISTASELRSLFLFVYRSQLFQGSKLSPLSTALLRKPLLHTVVISVFHQCIGHVHDYRPIVNSLRLLPRLRHLELDLGGNTLGREAGTDGHS